MQIKEPVHLFAMLLLILIVYTINNNLTYLGRRRMKIYKYKGVTQR
jgi:hypothetical protein